MKKIVTALIFAIGFGVAGSCAALGNGAAVDATKEGAVDMENVSVPIVIAHRGASGARPEHTLGGYQLAIQYGADYIEPDLVMTSDGHLVARHDVYLSSTTNVADLPEFADRKRTFDGITDWFVFDFTLEELKQLRTRQPRAGRSTEFDGLEPIATIEEIIALVKKENATRSHKTGLYIEMKRPAAHKAMGLDPTDALVGVFKQLEALAIPTYFQCFEADYLRSFPVMKSVPLIYLIEGEDDPKTGRTHAEYHMAQWATEFAGLGINKALLLSDPEAPGQVVKDAHEVGLKIHIWTIRNDAVPAMFENGAAELKAVFALDVDGIFTDHSDVAISVLAGMKSQD